MRKSTVALCVLALSVSCGPRPPSHEPKPAPDDTKPDLPVAAQFLETSPIPPEVMKAIEKQRDLVVAKPAPMGEITYKFPDIEEGKLKNGMKWYLVHQPELPMVSLNFVSRAGTAYEPADLPGLAVFTGDMLREGGTESRTSGQLSEDIEKLGANLSIMTADDYTLVAVDSLSASAGDLVKMLGEIVTKPAFREDDLESFRKREMNRLSLYMSDPEYVADRVFVRELYGTHPYSHYDTTYESLGKITRDDVSSFHKDWYKPMHSFFVAVGDITSAELGPMLESSLGPMKDGVKNAKGFGSPEPLAKRRVVIVDRPGSAQTVIRVGNLALDAKNPDALALKVTNHALGGNASSRLFMTLREDKGLTYGCYSNAALKAVAGAFYVETSTKTASTIDSVDAIFEEMSKLVAEDPSKGGMTEGELAEYRNYLAGVLPIKAQAPSRIADMLIDRIVYWLPGDYYDTYAQKVQAVDVATLQKTANKYIKPDQALIVLVGDAKAFEKQAAKWGEVTKVEP
jgi:predicted Zn-dependent peptidase